MSEQDTSNVEQKVDWSVKNSDYFDKIIQQVLEQKDEKRRATAMKTKEEVEAFILQQMETSAQVAEHFGSIQDLNTTLSRSEMEELVAKIRQTGRLEISLECFRWLSAGRVSYNVSWRFEQVYSWKQGGADL